jgi:hypothetical protein
MNPVGTKIQSSSAVKPKRPEREVVYWGYLNGKATRFVIRFDPETQSYVRVRYRNDVPERIY